MALCCIPFCYCTAPFSGFVSLRNSSGWPSIAGKPVLQFAHKKSSAPLLCKMKSSKATTKHNEEKPNALLGRKCFPDSFTFGAASSAYQVEGGANEGGRGPSIWDTFAHNHPEKIDDHSSGDGACYSYRLYKEDVKMLKCAGMDAYRFSISWSRILPKGSIKGGINHDGITYYNNLINELIQNGIEPFVTIFHWDVPQALEDEYGGFLNRRILDDFEDYCKICFSEFGDRVKHWITLNEPWTFSSYGYDTGVFAPGRCSKLQGGCALGDSAREPYVVTHNLILAHAVAVKLYRDKFQEIQGGEVGITLVSQWMTPFSNSKHHDQAAYRALDFMLGWYLDPLVHGDYPFIMRALVRERLPCFTEEESKMIKGSYDFIGINYYTARYAYSLPISANDLPISYSTDSYVDLKVEKDGVPIGELSGSNWLYVYPEGIRDLLVYMKEKYNDPAIYITENGTCELDNDQLSLEEALDDQARVKYYALHLSQVQEAIRLGVTVKGYFAWSLMDNYEWNNGYTMRFGLAYVDYKNGLKRYPKASFQWFTKFLKS